MTAAPGTQKVPGTFFLDKFLSLEKVTDTKFRRKLAAGAFAPAIGNAQT
jgi:hypothetical protein